jgi:hypothetical protein
MAKDPAAQRLSGSWRVTIVDIEARDVLGAPTTARRRWKFIALCETGACAVQLRREVNGGRAATVAGMPQRRLSLTRSAQIVPQAS